MTEAQQDEQKQQSLDNLELLMAATAQKAVDGTLQKLGIDTNNPLSAQQDFARLRTLRKLMEDEGFVADLAFMRRWRLNSEKVTDAGLKAVVRWFVVGVLGLIVLLTKDWWITHIKG
jgi:hypothetical protein